MKRYGVDQRLRGWDVVRMVQEVAVIIKLVVTGEGQTDELCVR